MKLKIKMLKQIKNDMCKSSPVNQHGALFPIFPILQSILNEFARCLELAKKILILCIIDFNTQVVVLCPVFNTFEIIFQDRDDMRDAFFVEG
jgi:hypothetical protein